MKITGIETTLFEPTWDDPLAHRYRRTHAAIRLQTDEGLVGNSRTSGAGVKIIQGPGGAAKDGASSKGY